MNMVMVETARRNLEQPNRFAVSGNDGNSYGGFVTFSSYLLLHPALKPVDKIVLQYLIYQAESYDALQQCKPVKCKADQQKIIHETKISRATVQRSLGRVEGLGIIRRTGTHKHAVYELLPGPWPRLGDAPEKGRRWQDWALRVAGVVGSWLDRFFDQTVTVEEVEEFAREESTVSSFMPKPKKKKRSHGPQNEAHFDEHQNEAHSHGHQADAYDEPIPSGEVGIPSPRKKPVQDGDFATQPRARGRARGVSNTISSLSPDRARPAGSLSLPEADSAQANPQRAAPGDLQADGSKVDSTPASPAVYTAYTDRVADLKRTAEAASQATPKKKSNWRSRFKATYRRRLEEEHDVVFSRWTPKREKQITNIARDFDGELLVKMVDWLFDNWHYLQRAETGLYDSDAYPPFRVLVSYEMVAKYEPFVNGEKSLKPIRRKGVGDMNDKRNWFAHTQKQLEDPNAFDLSEDEAMEFYEKALEERGE